MSHSSEIDYGPLKHLIGVWKGGLGVDIAPEPEGQENNPYFETITYTVMGGVTNAERQFLGAIHYRQIVQRESNSEVFHDPQRGGRLFLPEHVHWLDLGGSHRGNHGGRSGYEREDDRRDRERGAVCA